MRGSIDRAPSAGRTFGKYRTLAVLGHGGMATVYLAAGEGPGGFSKLVVVKELRPELAEDPEFRQMFLAEARLAARLHHANVVQTYEVLEDRGSQVIVMEYLEGQPLSRVRHRLASMGSGATPALLRILADALAGLHYAHELTDYDGTPLRVVHRDVSPHNIFVTYAGEAKVVDFGVAKVGASSIRTATGVIKGKLSYMAPEQALGLKIDRRADVFAAGVILWEMATGKRIWGELADVVILARLSAREVPRIAASGVPVPPEIARICDRATAPNADDRYATAAEMRHDLENYLARLPDRVRMRDVGEVVSEAFADERRKIRAVVEEQMRFTMDLPSGEYAAHPLAVIEAPRASTSTITEAPEAGSIRSQVTTVERSASSRTNASPIEPTSPPKRRALVFGGAIGVVALAIVAALVWRSAPSTPSAAAVPSASVPTTTAVASAAPSAPPAAAPPSSITLHVEAEPPQAKIFFDDEPLAGNPVDKRVAADGSTHRLRAEAPGYATQSEAVVLDHDRTWDPKLLRKSGEKVPRGDKGEKKPGGEKVDLGF